MNKLLRWDSFLGLDRPLALAFTFCAMAASAIALKAGTPLTVSGPILAIGVLPCFLVGFRAFLSIAIVLPICLWFDLHHLPALSRLWHLGAAGAELIGLLLLVLAQEESRPSEGGASRLENGEDRSRTDLMAQLKAAKAKEELLVASHNSLLVKLDEMQAESFTRLQYEEAMRNEREAQERYELLQQRFNDRGITLEELKGSGLLLESELAAKAREMQEESLTCSQEEQQLVSELEAFSGELEAKEIEISALESLVAHLLNELKRRSIPMPGGLGSRDRKG